MMTQWISYTILSSLYLIYQCFRDIQVILQSYYDPIG